MANKPSRQSAIVLSRLHDLAYHTDQATKELRNLARVAARVTQSGMRDRYVRGIVARAVKHVLDNDTPTSFTSGAH
jgi:hypothetical protein